ncbi:MAG TPA: PP0621 family protein [Pyrinomonadaceae bacterium]
MKYLVVLALFAIVLAYVYWRLRPYIRGARRVLATLRDVRRMQQGARPSDLPRQSEPKAASKEKLVRCAACGTWTPSSKAVRLGAGATYCSHACLERAADSPGRARKSAS